MAEAAEKTSGQGRLSFGIGVSETGASPPPVEFDDTTVKVDTEIKPAAVGILNTSGAINENNISNGESRGVSAYTYGMPGRDNGGMGLSGRVGGLSIGLFASDFSSYGLPSIAPDIGIGGVHYIPGLGFFMGIWSTAGLMAPEATGFMLGIQAVKAAFEIASSGELKNDPESAMIYAKSRIVSAIIPAPDLLDTLSVLRIRAGLGKEQGELKTQRQLEAFQGAANDLIDMDARIDAAESIDNTLEKQKDPYVKAVLMDLEDRAIFKENAKGLPFARPRSIEANMRSSIERVEEFKEKHGEWLKCGEGKEPSASEIDQYMADALYLVLKLRFEYEHVQKGELAKNKIRESTPFDTSDPELAVRFMVATGSIYAQLANANSGLTRYVEQKSVKAAGDVADSAEALRSSPDAEENLSALLQAAASETWNISWVEAMAAIHSKGYLYERMDHVRWVVNAGTVGGQKKVLKSRLDHEVEFANTDLLRQTLASMAAANIPPGLRDVLNMGTNSIMAADALADASFNDLGEFKGTSSSVNPESVKRRAGRRMEIVDAFYLLAPTVIASISEAGSGRKKSAALLRSMAESSRKMITQVMKENQTQVRREWYRYCARPDIYIGRMRKGLTEKIDTAIEAMDKEIARNGKNKEELKPLSKSLAALKDNAANLSINGFRRLNDIKDIASKDTKMVDGLLRASSKILAGDELKPIREKVEAIGQAYERLNTKRVGAFFLEHSLKKAGIDPTVTPEEMKW